MVDGGSESLGLRQGVEKEENEVVVVLARGREDRGWSASGGDIQIV